MPAFLCRYTKTITLAAGVAELDADLRRAVLVHEFDDLLPRLDLLVVVVAVDVDLDAVSHHRPTLLIATWSAALMRSRACSMPAFSAQL